MFEERRNMTEKEKMLAGMLYDPSDPELSALLVKARKLARRYNQMDEDELLQQFRRTMKQDRFEEHRCFRS